MTALATPADGPCPVEVCPEHGASRLAVVEYGWVAVWRVTGVADGTVHHRRRSEATYELNEAVDNPLMLECSGDPNSGWVCTWKTEMREEWM